MPRLRRSDCSSPGITRVPRGKGFAFLGPDGRPIDDETVRERIEALVIPPAWKEVWICPWPHGHIQATGVDAAGRKQYLYHEEWRARRDRAKFEDMIGFARDLPALRRYVEGLLAGTDELTRERVLACAIRLLDRGFFRIGSEDYAVTNETYGLATIRKRHVRLDPERHLMTFDYPAKSGKRRIQDVVDPLTFAILARLKRRRGGGDELLAYKEGRVWRDIKSADINAFLKEATGGDHSAKDFRTWNATILCAVALSMSREVATTKTGRKRAVARAIKEVSRYLGNTPAVCRASYVDPRIIDAFEDGRVLDADVVAGAISEGKLPIHDPAVEEAVLGLLEGHEYVPGVHLIAA